MNHTNEKKSKPEPAPERDPAWNPADDLYGEVHRPVDADLDLDDGKFSKPPPKRTQSDG